MLVSSCFLINRMGNELLFLFSKLNFIVFNILYRYRGIDFSDLGSGVITTQRIALKNFGAKLSSGQPLIKPLESNPRILKSLHRTSTDDKLSLRQCYYACQCYCSQNFCYYYCEILQKKTNFVIWEFIYRLTRRMNLEEERRESAQCEDDKAKKVFYQSPTFLPIFGLGLGHLDFFHLN